MLDWLLAPLDPGRAHEVGAAVSWHARLMVLSWGVLAPGAVFVARFFKVMPGQDWPDSLDNRFWWSTHWRVQVLVLALSCAGLSLILLASASGGPGAGVHRVLGYGTLALGLGQGLSGLLRGTKGGPTDPGPDGSWAGDHYDMTPRRRAFERFHKTAGYAALAGGAGAILLGLWMVNAPRWMGITILGFWAGLGAAGMVLQARGRAVDTYQAIWGPDPRHPGNRR